MIRDLVTEFYLGPGAGWVDASASVLQDARVTITRGRQDERGLGPSEIGFTLLDDGRWSPRNPTGPYFGVLGQGVPCRICLRLFRHTFAAAVSNGWASVVDANGAVLPWTYVGNASGFAQAGGVGTHDGALTNAYRECWLAGVSQRLVDVSLKWSLPGVAAVTGGNLEPANLLLRGQSAGNCYLVRIIVDTSGLLLLQVRKVVGGVDTLLGSTVGGLGSYAAGTTYRVRAQADGWAIRARVWVDGQPEPLAWHIERTDATYPAAGYVGVRSGLAAGNTNVPVTFAYDDLELRSPRGYGDTVKLEPAWNLNHTQRTVAVTVSGALRRLKQGRPANKTALQRWYEQQPAGVVSGYWPGEDGKTSETLAPVIGNVDMSITNFGPGEEAAHQQMQRGELAAWMNPTLGTAKGFRVLATAEDLPLLPAPTLIWVDHVHAGGVIENHLLVNCYNFAWTIEMSTAAAGDMRLVTPSGTTGTVSPPSLTDGAMHHIRLLLQQFGANVDYHVYVDGVDRLFGTVAGFTLAAIQWWGPQDTLDHADNPLLYAHFAYGYGSAPNLANTVAAAFGWPGEDAIERLTRLCDEESIPFAWEGATATLVGPQRPISALQSIEETARTDMGSLVESRTTDGLVFRPQVARLSQAARATIDYGAEQVAPGFQPVDDDQRLRNAVTVKRTYGGQVSLQQSTGRLAVDSIGLYEDGTVELNLADEAQLDDAAGWLLHEGTIDEARFRTLRVEFASPGVTSAVAAALLDADADDLLVVTNLAAAKVYDDVRLIVLGYVETLNTQYLHSLAFNAAPAATYDVFELEHVDRGRLHPTAGSVASTAMSNAGTLSVASAAGTAVWTTNPAMWPFDVLVDGARLRVTAVAGSTSPQTFTTTLINGVAKQLAAGKAVELFSGHVLRR